MFRSTLTMRSRYGILTIILGLLFVGVLVHLAVEHTNIGTKTKNALLEDVRPSAHTPRTRKQTYLVQNALLEDVRPSAHTPRTRKQTYLVHWYRLVGYLAKRPDAVASDFSTCHYSNCRITFDQQDAERSDAVIFHGQRLPGKIINFKRPRGQIWIFANNESPLRIYKEPTTVYSATMHMKDAFNWTMYYDQGLSDIHLPYGDIRKHQTYVTRDYDKIAATKTKGALIITSNCDTPSKRMEYINELKKYTDVDVLGTCGTEWNCGTRLYHNNCFDILNDTYSFYLAFENAFCQQYFTEKLFENYKYDTLIVSRGGRDDEASTMFPKGSVINANEFNNASELGKYLNMLRRDKQRYAERLAEKSQYYVQTYKESYQQALCDLCRRLNHQDAYHRTIPDILEIFHPTKSCSSV